MAADDAKHAPARAPADDHDHDRDHDRDHDHDHDKDKDKDMDKREKRVDIDEHLLPLDELCARYGTLLNAHAPQDSLGLPAQRNAEFLQRDGLNQLSPPKKRHPVVQYLHCVATLFNILLIVSGIMCFVIFAVDPAANFNNSWFGAILVVVAFLNGFIEFYQLQKSAAILESFLNLIPANCYAIREGAITQASATTLAVGDLVFVRLGDKIPADIRIVKSTDFKVDNSSLTGESEPQERTPRNTHDNPLEATNLAFNGTLAVNGEAYGIVVRTGDRTVIGQIASLTAGEEKRASPMSEEIDRFVKLIASVAFVTAVVFLLVGLLAKKMRVGTAVNFAIGTFVSFVPEGLPATVTMLLTIAAKRMAGRNVLVKDLQGVETLGAITLLATDKTGTLTRNQMTVTFMWTGFRTYYCLNKHDEIDPDVEHLDTEKSPGAMDILMISALCCKAKFDRTDVPVAQRTILGDATETGLVRFAAETLPDFDSLGEKYPKVFEIPFNSENKWHMSIHKKEHADGKLTLYIKGAPERILRLCDKVFDGERTSALTDEHKKAFQEKYKALASKGHRVLAFARLCLPGDKFPEDFEFSKDPVNYPAGGYVFQGLCSLEDPPKHGVREAIGHCREAGIKVMMVTGDHPLTAEAIGRKINLVLQETKQMVADRTKRPLDEIEEHEYNAIVIHGEMIDELSDADWARIFSKEEIIFARTSPKHKLQIVKRAQARGHIVGVTGDGVNDSPALKKADLGIAMNQSGSDVSKEAAAMILLDDNFASTVSGIEEGRLIFSNLKKSIQYTITHTMPQVWANLLFILVPIPLPLSPILILFVDLGFELIASLSYAWDKPEDRSSLMKLPPRKPVTERSIEKLEKQRKSMRVNPDTGELLKPTAWERFSRAVKAPFTRQFWSELNEETDEEVLVDGNVLSWAYLEAGTISTIACLTAYFVTFYWQAGLTPADLQIAASSPSPNEYFVSGLPPEAQKSFTAPSNGVTYTYAMQMQALGEANSAYYFGIFFMQMFNLFICKARYGFPFGKFMFTNKVNFISVVVGFAFAAFIVYPPPFNAPFVTSWTLSPLMWLIPIAFGILLLAYATVRTAIIRARNPIKYTREVIGLQMYPTRWSTSNA